MTKCQTCGGTYAAVQSDGTRYFHACPTLTDAEVITALGLNVDRTKWTALEAQTFAAAPRVRPNARNENAPDHVAQKALVDAATQVNDPDHWKRINAALDTAVVSAGAGTIQV